MDLSLLYTAILSLCHPGDWPDQRLLVLFCQLVRAVIVSKTISLPDGLPFIDGKAVMAQSKERRLSRWLLNERIEVPQIYGPMIYAALSSWGARAVYLAFDTCLLWENYCCLRLCVCYRGRAIPIAWKVIEHKSSSVAFEVYGPWIKEVSRWIPSHLRVVFLGDRAFGDHQLMALCRQLGWHFRLRLKASHWIGFGARGSRKLSSLKPPRGRACFFQNVSFGRKQYESISVALGHPSSGEIWIIATDETAELSTFQEYGLRFEVEECFLDEKSNGFQLENSRFRSTEAIEKLLLVLAVANLYLTLKGQEVLETNKRRWVDPHWRRGLSYLKIGWKWVLERGKNIRDLLVKLALDGKPDPEPAIASKKQAKLAGKRTKLHFFPHPLAGSL